jgi:hypothetical protein
MKDYINLCTNRKQFLINDLIFLDNSYELKNDQNFYKEFMFKKFIKLIKESNNYINEKINFIELSTNYIFNTFLIYDNLKTENDLLETFELNFKYNLDSNFIKININNFIFDCIQVFSKNKKLMKTILLIYFYNYTNNINLIEINSLFSMFKESINIYTLVSFYIFIEIFYTDKFFTLLSKNILSKYNVNYIVDIIYPDKSLKEKKNIITDIKKIDITNYLKQEYYKYINIKESNQLSSLFFIIQWSIYKKNNIDDVNIFYYLEKNNIFIHDKIQTYYFDNMIRLFNPALQKFL